MVKLRNYHEIFYLPIVEIFVPDSWNKITESFEKKLLVHLYKQLNSITFLITIMNHKEVT